jgi:hypothetical protein
MAPPPDNVTTTVTVIWPDDPTVVTCGVEGPDGIATTYIYGIDANVTRTGVGHYACAIPDPEPGTYAWGWAGTGETATSGTFTNSPTTTTLTTPQVTGGALAAAYHQFARMVLGTR